MADFSQVLPMVLLHEGGWVNDPIDRGGLTNLGLTKADFAQYYGRPATDEDVNSCTPVLAEKIYKTLFWDKMRLDQVQSQNIALCLMDQGVVCGQPTVVKKAQAVLGFTDKKIDGIMGMRTLTVLNNADEETFLHAFLNLMYDHYLGIWLRNPSQKKFIVGWLNRIHNLCVRTGISIS